MEERGSAGLPRSNVGEESGYRSERMCEIKNAGDGKLGRVWVYLKRLGNLYQPPS